jgi:hypothetical protein
LFFSAKVFASVAFPCSFSIVDLVRVQDVAVFGPGTARIIFPRDEVFNQTKAIADKKTRRRRPVARIFFITKRYTGMHNAFVSINDIKKDPEIATEILIKKGPAASRTPRTKPTVWIKDVLFRDQ